MEDPNNSKLSLDTLAAKDIPSSDKNYSHITPIHATSSFVYKSVQDSIDVFRGDQPGYVYSRYANPTVTAVENKLATLEVHGTELTAECIMTSSGLSAISTLAMALLNAGDAVITQADLYGGTTELLQKVLRKAGVEIITIDLTDTDLLHETVRQHDNIKLIYLETPTNPTLKCVDIQKVTAAAQELGILTAIDNTFCTFYLQQPFALGVDFIVYSTTKFLNGHGNSIAGAILMKDSVWRKDIWDAMKLMGTNCNAWDAWLLHNGLKTLAVRMDRHCHNATRIAQHLQSHPAIQAVNYPGLPSHPSHAAAKKQMRQYGGMLSFEIKGDINKAKAFMDNTKLCTIAATLGNVDTLLLHPASSSHLNIPKDVRLANGISDGLIRMSVGIENSEDLINDIDQALAD